MYPQFMPRMYVSAGEVIASMSPAPLQIKDVAVTLT
eukprot:XP_001707504.1 Hypothetical protein GL50803_97765 [Giardia lamblia ATCC 50803]